MTRELSYKITNEYNEKKLIAFLKGELKMSTRLLTKLKKTPDGLLRNGEHIRTVDIVHTNDIITINIVENINAIEPIMFDELNVIYEDEDILVINKPAGIAMHPTHNHQGDTLANIVSGYFCSKNKNPVFRAVGRLDKCTSGIVVIALNAHCAWILSDGIEKEYIALVEGKYVGSGSICKPIIRPYENKTFRWVGDDGEYAMTHWQSLACDDEKSILRIKLETGRTHQIRVHFASNGTPLLGDDMYGSEVKTINRAALHCAKISFIHPITNKKMIFEAELPEDMKQIACEIEAKKINV